MAPADTLDDEAVARLLADDARAASSRYASQGLSALLPKRANGGAPKPNTRFLKNLVRDADNHNAALRRKEEQERRERLRQLDRRSEWESGQRHDRNRDREGGRERKRQRLDDQAIEDRHEKHRRTERSGRHRKRNTSSEASRSRSRSRNRDRNSHKRHKPRDPETTGRRKDVPQPRPKRYRSRSRSVEPPSRRNKEHRSDSTHSPAPSNASSDPLEDLVGPLPATRREISPAVRSRGRGAHKQSGSVMDSHFGATYDPALDVHPDSEDSAEREDWDMALEALRDRQQWKRKHADRMREAGFGDDDIKKWEDSGKEKSAGDLKWRKAGEAREWDAGKSAPSPEEDHGRLSRKMDADLESSWKRKSGGLLKDLKSTLR